MRQTIARLAVLPFALSAHAAIAAGDFEFAKTKIGDFDLTAKTEYKWDDGDPYIVTIDCEGVGNDFNFAVGRDGALQYLDPSFHGPPDEDGDPTTITALGDVLWLYVDGRKFQFRNIPTPDSEFKNHAYPPDPNIGQPMILTWRGYRGVRASGADPFMNMSRIYDEIVAAKKLEWGFISRNWKDVDPTEPENQLPADWKTHRYRIDNRNLREAVDWCTRQVASDAATHFPDELK